MSTDRTHELLTRDLQENGGILSGAGLKLLDELDGVVLLESVKGDRKGQTFVFDTLVDEVWADRAHEVMPALVRLQMWIERGYHVAGYVAYEAAPAFLRAPVRDPERIRGHLLWFGVYEEPIIVERTGTWVPHPAPDGGLTIGQIHPLIAKAAYQSMARRVRAYLERGHTYQVNLTFPLEGRWTGSSIQLYERLRTAQPVPYAAYLRHDDTAIVSLSPELFFRLEGDRLTLKPMKGTARRGRTTSEDGEIRSWLASSEKDQAENRMIVDLLRNDAGRLAVPGTVKVPSFFDIEQHPTIFQATSTITARVKATPNIVDVFSALFPCGSITGAPKVETIRIIDELEPETRGVYTGAIGYWSPTGNACFSVAIRTLESDEEEGTFRIGIGSGMTIASDVGAEYDECLLKARFLEQTPEEFALIETMRWERGSGIALLDGHLERLADSSRYFGWETDIAVIRATILRETRTIGKAGPQKVRLQVRENGTTTLAISALDDITLPVTVGFARKRVSSLDKFQYHKTTRRPLYVEVLAKAEQRGWYDAIVLNERGEVAEGCRTTVIIRRGDRLLTPPISAGILPGVLRTSLLRQRAPRLIEVTLMPDDLRDADELFVGNAVRGLLPARLAHGHV